jgi:hypothetical protein
VTGDRWGGKPLFYVGARGRLPQLQSVRLPTDASEGHAGVGSRESFRDGRLQMLFLDRPRDPGRVANASALEVFQQWPICSKLKRDFQAEFPQKWNPPPGYAAPDWQAMQEPFQCDAFAEYRPGWTPLDYENQIERARDAKRERYLRIFELLVAAALGGLATYVVTALGS